MANQVRIVLDRAGVRSLLQSSEIETVIKECCEHIEQRAGSDLFVSDTRVGRNRIQGMVKSRNAHGYYHNLKNNTLAKSLK